MAKPLYIDISQKLEVDVFEPAAATGIPVPATGIVDARLRIAAVEDGPAIHPDLDYLAVARSSVSHRYFADPPLADLRTRLAALEGADVFIVFSKLGAFEGMNFPRTVMRKAKG